MHDDNDDDNDQSTRKCVLCDDASLSLCRNFEIAKSIEIVVLQYDDRHLLRLGHIPVLLGLI